MNIFLFILQENNGKGNMMAVRIHGLTIYICQSKRHAGDLSVPNIHTVMWLAVLIDDDGIQGHLTCNSPDYVGTPIGSNRIVSRTDAAS